MKKFDEQITDQLQDIIPQLVTLGVKKVEIELSGSGDEGAVDKISFDKVEQSRTNQDSSLLDELDQLAYDIVTDQHAGWEVNEGGFGSVTLNIKSGKCRLSWSERRIVTDDTEAEFKIEKSKK